MKQQLLFLILVGPLLGGCGKTTLENETLAPGEVAKWNDPNFEIIGVGAYNYTDYDIYDVFVLPKSKSDIKFAADASGGRATSKGSKKWGFSGGGANFAWDYRWTTPKTFKVWWFRIVDMKAYVASGRKYNKYIMKDTEPGGAWCESDITIEHPPRSDRISELIIHYYPDGRIDGDIISGDVDATQVDISQRDALPVLKDRACLKEVSNPYFGKKKPIDMY
jgi:hypothetical protein